MFLKIKFTTCQRCEKKVADVSGEVHICTDRDTQNCYKYCTDCWRHYTADLPEGDNMIVINEGGDTNMNTVQTEVQKLIFDLEREIKNPTVVDIKKGKNNVYDFSNYNSGVEDKDDTPIGEFKEEFESLIFTKEELQLLLGYENLFTKEERGLIQKRLDEQDYIRSKHSTSAKVDDSNLTYLSAVSEKGKK